MQMTEASLLTSCVGRGKTTTSAPHSPPPFIPISLLMVILVFSSPSEIPNCVSPTLVSSCGVGGRFVLIDERSLSLDVRYSTRH